MCYMTYSSRFEKEICTTLIYFNLNLKMNTSLLSPPQTYHANTYFLRTLPNYNYKEKKKLIFTKPNILH